MAGVVLHLDTLSIADSAASIGAPSDGSPTPKSQEYWRPTAKPKGLLVTFKGVSYSLNVAKNRRLSILQDVSGYFEPGQMTAVMGPSGSGKTTFLDALAGRKTTGQLSGDVTFGGCPPTPGLLRRATGYVEQFDTLVDTLTVQEMLLYTAQLKRPMSEGYAAKKEAVEHLVSKLALHSCSTTRIGSPLKRGISGGQAKRVNIGIALITDPRVLFLDEPTSGLDSFTANEVMAVVKGLTKDGTTIATTIHSPSSCCYSLFDGLLVLLGGQVVYFGSPQEAAISFFTEQWGGRCPKVGDNLAEWMLDLVVQADRNGEVERAAAVYRSSQLYKDNQYHLNSLLTTERLQLAASSSFVDFECAAQQQQDKDCCPAFKEPPLESTSSGSTTGSSTIAARRHRSSSGSGSGEGCTRRAAKRSSMPSQLALQGSVGYEDPSWVGLGTSSSVPLPDQDPGGPSSPAAAATVSRGAPGGTHTSGSNGRNSGSSRLGNWRKKLSRRVRVNLKDLAYTTPPWWSLRVLLSYRTLRNYSTWEYLAAHLVDKYGFALVLLSLFWRKGSDFGPANVPVQISLMFLLVAAPAWGAVAYVPSIVLDRALFIRERQDGLYSPLVYLTFKMLDEMLLLCPASLGTAAIIYYGIQLRGSFLLFWLISYVTLANGIAIAYLISALSSTMAMANAAVPLLLSCALVFCGFIIRQASMPLYYLWILKANVFHYSWGALMVNQYDKNRNALLGGMRVLNYYGLQTANAWNYLGICCGFLVGWTSITWLALQFGRKCAR